MSALMPARPLTATPDRAAVGSRGIPHQWVLQLREVTRLFAGSRAVGPVSLCCAAGTVCWVRGDNGSGKTTLLRLAAGLLTPSSGVRIAAGRALYLDAKSAGRAGQTIDQALRFIAQVSGAPLGAAPEAATAAGLEALGTARLGALSAGQRARVTMAVAQLAAPDLVCLDEPGVHLDPAGRDVVRRTVATLAARGSAVLISGHDPDLVADLCDVTVVLRDGLPAQVRR